MSDYGTRLTAKFFEACGRDICPEDWGEYPAWCDDNADWHPVPDYTQPGHLETVLGMVRERWPDAVIDLLGFQKSGEATLSTTSKGWWGDSDGAGEGHGDDLNLATALMLATIRAAGLTPPD